VRSLREALKASSDVPPGAVIVIDNDGRTDVTVWGGIMTEIAAVRGIAGTVINGVCRDVSASLAQNYPLFSRGRFMRTGKDRVRLAVIGKPVAISGIEIQPGTLICADADGVVAVPAGEAGRITETAERIERIVAAARRQHPARGPRNIRLPHPADEAAMTDTAPAATDVKYEQVDLRVGGVGLTVAAVGRDGDLAPVVFLHGFGSTKEDYLDLACQRAFTGHPFLAYDAPGCGETFCEDLSSISIPFLVKNAQALLDHADIRRFHLVGHSMGGLTALMLAHQEPDRVLSFTDIEGNLAPEDCFLSRQILAHPSDDDGFLDDFVERTRRSYSSSSALFAVNLRHKVRPGAVRGIFQSMVDLSDHDDLVPKFLTLPCPRLFMYGEENSTLSYLAKLAAGGVELADPAQRALADVRQPGRDVGTHRRVHPPGPGPPISIAPTSASGTPAADDKGTCVPGRGTQPSSTAMSQSSSGRAPEHRRIREEAEADAAGWMHMCGLRGARVRCQRAEDQESAMPYRTQMPTGHAFLVDLNARDDQHGVRLAPREVSRPEAFFSAAIRSEGGGRSRRGGRCQGRGRCDWSRRSGRRSGRCRGGLRDNPPTGRTAVCRRGTG